jgi:hypothetical protein
LEPIERRVEEIKTMKQNPTAPKRRIGFVVEDSRRKPALLISKVAKLRP